MFGMITLIEPYLKFYAVPPPSLYMTLRSRSQALNFNVKYLQCLVCKAFNGYDSCLAMNIHKIIKFFRIGKA